MAVVLNILSKFDDRGIKSAQRNLAKLGSSAKGFAGSTSADLVKAGAGLQSFGDGMVKTGRSLTMGLTLPLAAIGGVAVRESVKFESAFAGVRKTVDATEAEFAKLKTGIRDMAKEIPASREAIAGVAEAAGQLGISKEHILSFTRTMVDLGEATNLTSDEAATSLARFANIVQMPQESFDRLGSSIVALGNNMATTESEIVSMGMRIAGAGSQVGMTEPQIMAVAAALSSVGIAADAGGTAISKTMIGIEAAVQSGGDQLRLWAETAGMSASEFAAAWKSDPAAALNAVITGLGQMEEQGGSTLTQLEALGITEVRQRDALLRAAGAGDLLTSALKISGDAWGENNALAKEAAERYKTTESQLSILRNRASDAALTIGEQLAPSFLGVVKSLTRLAEGFTKLPRGVQGVIVKLALAAAAAGPLLMVFGKITRSAGTLVKTIGNIGLAFGKNAEAAPLYARAIAGVTKNAGKLGKAFLENVKSIGKQSAALVVSAAKSVAHTAATVASRAAQLAAAAASKVWAAAQWLLNAAMSANPIGLVVVAIAGLVAAFVIAWKKSETFRKIVIAAWNAIKAAAKRVFDWIASYLRRWISTVRTVLRGIGAVADWVRGQWNRIRDGAASAFNSIVSFVRGLPGRIKSAVGSGARLLYGFGADILRGVWNGMSSIAGWLKDRIYGFFKNLLPGWARKALGISSPSTVFAALGLQAAQGMAVGLDAGAKLVSAAAERLAGASLGGGQLAVSLAGAGPAGGSVVIGAGAVQVTVNVSGGGDPAALRSSVKSGVEDALHRLARELKAT